MIDDPPRVDDEALLAAVRSSWYDEPTGLPGPAFWQAVLKAESARCARYRRSATVVLAQIVGLDDVVGSWGRDVALRSANEVADVLRSSIRASDYMARLADDRFGIILTETNEIAAINMIERVRVPCDLALSARAAGGRIAFGWADPKAPLFLVDAVHRAADRLLDEASGR